MCSPDPDWVVDDCGTRVRLGIDLKSEQESKNFYYSSRRLMIRMYGD